MERPRHARKAPGINVGHENDAQNKLAASKDIVSPPEQFGNPQAAIAVRPARPRFIDTRCGCRAVGEETHRQTDARLLLTSAPITTKRFDRRVIVRTEDRSQLQPVVRRDPQEYSSRTDK